MLKVCNIDIENRKKIYEELDRFIAHLKKKFFIDRIYLYGSFAKEEIHEGSDIDLVIVGRFTGSMFDRINKILKLTDLPIELLVYTPEEFERMKRNNNPFIKEVIATGREL